jgi:hypothetical protein
MLPFALSLGLIWGAIWAAFLQWHRLGRFLAVKRTWITVVIGVGVDLLLVLLVVSLETWLYVVAVLAASSVPIVARSLYNEFAETLEILSALTDQAGE